MATEIATSGFNGQQNRAMQNEATPKAIKRAISIGWGGRDRTSEWRNQNQIDYLTISKRIWKKGSKCPLAISIAWPPFPNEEAAVAGRISLAKSEATGCARADREGHGVDSSRPQKSASRLALAGLTKSTSRSIQLVQLTDSADHS